MSRSGPERKILPRDLIAFKPPKPRGWVMAIGDAILPYVLRKLNGVAQVRWGSSIESLSRLQGQRVLLTPNHPTHAEPAILYYLSRKAKRRFYFVSNRESFDRASGLFGWLLQSCCAYSILRGAPDRESFRMTRQILSEGPNALVIFPEGEVYSQNDTLLPFQSGVVSLAFFALEDMHRSHVSEPLLIQPVAIRYHFLEDMARAISGSLRRLESALGLRGTPPSDPYARLRRAGDALIASAEEMYGLSRGAADDLDPRIEAIKNAMVKRVALAVGLSETALGNTMPEKMRTLINAVYTVARDAVVPESIYDVRLRLQEQERIRPLQSDLARLGNWIAVRDQYVGENPTQERFVETLRRMEIEVFGNSSIRGRKACTVQLADPFDLREYLGDYEKDKKATAQKVTMRIEESVTNLLSASV